MAGAPCGDGLPLLCCPCQPRCVIGGRGLCRRPTRRALATVGVSTSVGAASSPNQDEPPAADHDKQPPPLDEDHPILRLSQFGRDSCCTRCPLHTTRHGRPVDQTALCARRPSPHQCRLGLCTTCRHTLSDVQGLPQVFWSIACIRSPPLLVRLLGPPCTPRPLKPDRGLVQLLPRRMMGSPLPSSARSKITL